MEVVLRVAAANDAAIVNETYGYYIEHSLANFGEQNKTVAERAQEIEELLKMYPFLIAEDENGRFLGFACAEPYRPKSGYRYTAELTIYLHPDTPKGCGVGSALYEMLLECLLAQGFRIAVGVIHDQNHGSLALHRHFGFKQAGALRNYCYKHGQWVSAVILEKVLNPFDDEPNELIPFAEYRRIWRWKHAEQRTGA